MKRFIDRPTRDKLIVGFGLGFILLVIVIGAAHRGMAVIQESQRSLQESQRNLYKKDFANTVDLLELRRYLQRSQTDVVTMMLVTRRADQRMWHDDIRLRAHLGAEIVQSLLKRNQNDPSMQGELEELNTIVKEYERVRDELTIPLIYAGKIEQAKASLFGEQYERFFKIRSKADNLGNIALTQAERRIDESQRHIDQSAKIAAGSTRVFMIVGLVALLLGVAMVTFLTQTIANPLRNISEAAERIAVGDLTVSVPCTHRRDEVGTLAQAFNRMTHSLQRMAEVAEQMAAGNLKVKVEPQSEKDMLGNAFAAMAANLQRMTADVVEAASVLGSSASEILASTTQLASTSTQTATAVSQTTTTIEEIRQTAQVASQKAQYVSESAQRAAHISQAGKHSTEETSAGIHLIQEQMSSIAEGMMRLSEQSQTIGAIIATVDDLAQQSNLLAVNASIEAAKAGEQGKGFAVVAQEVKNLADQSRQATMQVRGILSDIQKATAAAVLATEQGSKAVEAGVAQSAEAGESILRLAESVEQAAQAATQIAASSQQQLVGMEQVVLAMGQVKQASGQNVDSARQLEAAAQNLNQLGQRLQLLVARYKV